jgi:SAM-dependent methyltransferase
MTKQTKVLRNAINLHYLRPDNALWVYSIYKSVNKYLKKFSNKKYKSLDLGCGDGTTCYLATGGEIDKKFDVFHGTKFEEDNLVSNTIRSSSGSLKDIKGDMYDHYTKSYQKYCKPKFFKNKFTYGIDWKKTLLKKASLLKFYENLILQDCNKLPLKIKNNDLDLVFSTIIYWLKKPETLFPEVNRILKKGGYFIFTTPKENIIKYTLRNFLKKFDYKNIDRLDRGRYENWKRHSKKKSFWTNQIRSNNFEIVEIIELHPKLQLIIGESIVRTLMSAFGVLYKGLLPKNEKIFFKFKDKYVKEIFTILKPFAENKYYNDLDKAYNVFIVRKK